MSSEVSIVVRAIDATRAVFGRINRGLSSMAAGATSTLKSLRRMGSLSGLIGLGLGVRSIASNMKDMAKAARETGDFSIISEQQVRNLEGGAKFLSMMRDAATKLVSSGIDWTFGGGRLSELGKVQSDLEQAQAFEAATKETAARKIKEHQEEQVKLQKEARAEAEKSNELYYEALALRAKLTATDEDDLDALRKRIQSEQFSLSHTKKFNDQGALTSEWLTRNNRLLESRGELQDRLNQKDEEAKKAQDEKRQAAQKAFSERVQMASQQLQSDGLAFIASGRGRRITREQSAAMGQRIREMTGDDPAKFQQQTAFTLQQIYRLLGGGSSGKE